MPVPRATKEIVYKNPRKLDSQILPNEFEGLLVQPLAAWGDKKKCDKPTSQGNATPSNQKGKPRARSATSRRGDKKELEVNRASVDIDVDGMSPSLHHIYSVVLTVS